MLALSKLYAAINLGETYAESLAVGGRYIEPIREADNPKWDLLTTAERYAFVAGCLRVITGWVIDVGGDGIIRMIHKPDTTVEIVH